MRTWQLQLMLPWVLVSVMIPERIHPSVRVIQLTAIGSVSTNFRSAGLYKKYQIYLIGLEARDIRIAETSTLNSTIQTT